MTTVFRLFYERLPVPPVRADGRRLGTARGRELALTATAAGLAAAGFLAYYLPIYRFPHLFPSVALALPGTATTIRLPWGELLWCLGLTSIEIFLLTLLNIAGVHQIAVATGFIDAGTKGRARDALLGIGLERKTTEVTRYGIDPFEGLGPGALFLFNAVLRLKGWLGNQAIRYLARLLLGRYAVRTLLDFSGLPIYMAINALSVRAVLREARVILMGQGVVTRLASRLPRRALSPAEQSLLYDTLQYIAVSKRDFHRNHYLLTRELLARFRVPREDRHPLPPDYLDRLRAAPDGVLALCQAVILLGFVLDGHLSVRERRRLRELNARSLVRETPAEVARYIRDVLTGAGADAWLAPYLTRLAEEGRPAATARCSR